MPWPQYDTGRTCFKNHMYSLCGELTHSQGTESWFLAKCHYLSCSIGLKKRCGRREENCEQLKPPTSFFVILPCQRQVADPPWVGDPGSGRVTDKMTFTDLDRADDAVNWKNIRNTWMQAALVRSFHLLISSLELKTITCRCDSAFTRPAILRSLGVHTVQLQLPLYWDWAAIRVPQLYHV